MKKRLLSQVGNEDTYLSISSPHIEIDKNSVATVEGCVGILQYESDTIKINCENLTVKFFGENLEIENMNDQRICVKGDILSVEFCN